MKNKFLFFYFILLFLNNGVLSEEIDIVSDNIKILENGKIIKSFNSEAFIKEKKLSLQSNESLFYKDKNILIVENDVVFFDEIENVEVITSKANYNLKSDVLRTIGKTIINYKKDYQILSSDMIYDRKTKKISSKKETTLKDNDGNIYKIQNKFDLNLVSEVISTDALSVIDKKNNIYQFEFAQVDLANKEIAGKELKINFVDNYFGVSNNDPILKGRSAHSTESETKIYKAVFTTCNTENKSCPGWEIETEEFKHDKINKTFNYKNSWLKIFNKEIFYFPFFSHPDPTIKRKSGFLPPTYGSSNNYGSWINIPYFKAIDVDKDLTFKPRIYLDDKFIIQSEYRQAFENSNFISDLSYNNDGKNTNSHFFAKSNGKIGNNSSYNFQYQSVTNDEYLKLHNLSNSSELITNESLLTSKFYINTQIDQNTKLINEFFAYEDLSKKDSDRFQYVFPSFKFIKKVNTDENYNGNFYFNSTGYQKQYETNNYQAVLTNDFLFNSNNYISRKGFKSNYQFLIRHDNSFTSTPLNDKKNTELFQSILLKTELPLIKKTKKSSSYLKPILAFRLSPNNSKNISNKDLRLSYDNIFSFNRISSNRNIEEGRSLSIGAEYNRIDKNNNNIFKFGIANSISDKKNSNLPAKSKLNQTRSDLVGKINYNPTEILDIDYNFSYDRDLKNTNYQSISTTFDFEFINTNFKYLSEDNEIGNNETISNTTTINFNKENFIKFNSTKNLKTDFTEYYNLIYQYETDCLIASIEYKKKFYKDGSILPDKSLLFYLRFIPFAELRPEATNFK